MRYIYLSDQEFSEKYQYLVRELKLNELNKVKKTFQEIFKSLLSKYISQGNTFFIRNSDQKTFLHEAVVKENNALLKHLLEAGHEVDRLDNHYRSPLYDACKRLKLVAVNTLLDYGADPNLGYEENLPLIVTIENHAQITAEKLSKITGEKFFSLTEKQATERLEARIVANLIRHGVDINLQTGKDYLSPLHRAVALQKIFIVKEFVDNNVNFALLTKEGMSALHSIVEYRSKKQKQQEDEQGQMQREKEIADLVIPHSGAVFALQAEFGNTPLHTAVIGSNAEVVEAICKNDYLFPQLKLLSIQNDEGNTPIHEAIKEARRGPKVLNILLRLATEDDLAIINHEGESVLQMAERLIKQIESIKKLTDTIKTQSDELEDFFIGNISAELGMHVVADFDEFNKLDHAIDQLKNCDYFDLNISRKTNNQLESIDQILNKIKEKSNILSEEAEQLNTQIDHFVSEIYQKYLSTEYINALRSVKAEEYSAWKQQILQLPSSFTHLENSAEHQNELAIAHEEYSHSLLLLDIDFKFNAQTKLQESIKRYTSLKEYSFLEKPYQYLARLVINNHRINEIVDYEAHQQSLLHSPLSNYEEQLQAHLALAGLYKVLRMNLVELSPVTEQNLYAQESFHYSEAYKFIQGVPDSQAHIVLQRELGVTDSVKLGTYNIQQCVAVIAHDSNTNKVVLSHFDRYSGPLKFIDQILAEFPNVNKHSKIDLYLTGARDQSPDNKKVSDNNINQVLKQIYTYKERFHIKSTDLGNKLSPPAVIFDGQAKNGLRLQHRMPNRADISLDSRAAIMNLQFAKGEYLYPLNKIDFSQNALSRKKIFSPAELKQIQIKYDEYRNYYNDFSNCPETWKHNQLFQPLLAIMTETAGMSAIQSAQFKQGLLTNLKTSAQSFIVEQRFNLDTSFLHQQSKQPSTDLIEVLYHQNQVSLSMQAQRMHDNGPPSPLSQSISGALAILNDHDHDWDEEPHTKKICLPNRRKREAEACLFSWEDIDQFNLEKEKPRDSEKIIIDSTAFIESLKNSDEAKRAQLLQFATDYEITGDKQSDVRKLFQNNQGSAHLHKVESILSGLTEGIFAWDALKSFNGDKLALAQWVDFKAVNYVLKKVSKNLDRVGTAVFNGYDFYEQIKVLQKDIGNSDAWLRAATDGIQLSTDLSIAGVKLFEMSFERVAAMGISSLIEMEGGTLVAILMLGDRIYEDIEKVQREDHLLHLSLWSKITEGLRAFFNLNSVYQKQLDEITEYAHLLPKQFEFFSHHPDIKYLIFPAIARTGEKTVHYRERMMQRKTQTKKIPIFSTVKNNSVYFSNKLIGFKLVGEALEAPSGSEFICLPTGHDKSLPDEGAYACDGALGLMIKNSSATAAFFSLGEGEDHAVGFRNRSNIFIVNNGSKDYVGGDQDDIYLLAGQEIVTAVHSEGGVGGLDAGDGIDSLMLSEFQPRIKEPIEVNLAAGYLKYGNNSLRITHFERFYGGTQSLNVTVACDTHVLHIGGSTDLNTVLIPRQIQCHYDLKMYLCPNVTVWQEVNQGSFTYYLLPGNETGTVSVNLVAITDQTIQEMNSTLVFNATLSDVSAILFPVSKQDTSRTLQLQIIKPSSGQSRGNFTFELKTHLLNQTRLYFNNNAELRIGNKNLYYFQQELTQNISEIMDRHASIARRLNLICILKTHDNEQIVIGHKGHEVMRNNPKAFRTHMNGNGGEGVFVIESGRKLLLLSQLPLPEVVVHRRSEDTHIDTLDFRPLMKQIQSHNHTTAQLFFVTPNVKNNLGQDILLLLGMPVGKDRKIKVVATVRLKEVQNHWHKKYLHIILEIAPQRIVGRQTHLYLKPIPIEFNRKRKIAVISAKDVEANTDLIIPRAFKSGDWYQYNKTNLLWTNSLNHRSNLVEPFTLILVNFYQENKLTSLSLHFTDKKIALNNQFVRLNTLKDFKIARNQSDAYLKEESLTIMNAGPMGLQAPINNNLVEESNPIPGARVRRSIKNTARSAATQKSGIRQTGINTLTHWMPFFKRERQTNVPNLSYINGSLNSGRSHSFKSQKMLGLDQQARSNRSYDLTTFHGNVDLIIGLIYLFAPSLAKRMQMQRKELQMESISDEDRAFENLQYGIKKYGRG